MILQNSKKILVWLSFVFGLTLLTLDVYYFVPMIGEFLSSDIYMGVLWAVGIAYVILVGSFFFITAPFNKNSKVLHIILLILIMPAGLIVAVVNKFSGIWAKLVTTFFTIMFSIGVSYFLYIGIAMLLPKAMDYYAPFYYILAIVGSVAFVSIGRWIHDLTLLLFSNSTKLREEKRMTFTQASFWVAVVSLSAYFVASTVGVTYAFSESDKQLLDAVKDASGVFASVTGLIALGRTAYGKREPSLEEIKNTIKQELLEELRTIVAEDNLKFSAEQVAVACQNDNNEPRNVGPQGQMKRGNRKHGKGKRKSS
ncbi:MULTISPECIES: hypothetical protein [unclassified Paenibacillus]|uniref:Uncharacterized protein n=1 Tax=Paenibacillus provencensis TaxID=441151 RepID=A0ABW3Q9L8_9BACL|nr:MULTISPECIES: hypothetical protein [unclassified Paenibacillus]MCM3130166.1 hypothetical protein [Paenibacillus sp. MER 78]SDX70922.1 hypothetical protein SAMN05518848_11257 [Paenibacillus sp. PDC88]SFS88374.1 hypothetical protein SAMN04488601_10653 [Paenibacillus sp. 453mf]